MEPKINSQIPVSMAELKIEIEKIKKRHKEPSIRVTKLEDYLNSLSTSSVEQEKKLSEALKKLDVPRLKDEHIVKITDILPKTVDELKLIMQGYVISISNDNLKRIADTVNSVEKDK